MRISMGKTKVNILYPWSKFPSIKLNIYLKKNKAEEEKEEKKNREI